MIEEIPLEVRRREMMIAMLPSLELQLTEWMEASRQGLVAQRGRLVCASGEILLGFSDWLVSGQDKLELRLLDLVLIEIPSEKRGQGWFTSLRRKLLAEMPFAGIHYEFTRNSRLFEHFRREGLLLVDDEDGSFVELRPNILGRLGTSPVLTRKPGWLYAGVPPAWDSAISPVG